MNKVKRKPPSPPSPPPPRIVRDPNPMIGAGFLLLCWCLVLLAHCVKGLWESIFG